jgi:hypothetical protein
MKRTSTMSPLRGGAGDLGASTINAKNIDDEPLRGGAGDLGASTINAKNVNVTPWEAMPKIRDAHHQSKERRQWALLEAMAEIRECTPSTQRTLTMSPQGSDVGGAGVSTINTKNVNGGPLGRRCRRSKSVHHQRKKMSTVDPLGGGAEDPGAPTINAKNVDGRPPGRRCQRSGSVHHQRNNGR